MAKREPEPKDPPIEPEDDSDDPNVIAKRMIDEFFDRTERRPADKTPDPGTTPESPTSGQARNGPRHG